MDSPTPFAPADATMNYRHAFHAGSFADVVACGAGAHSHPSSRQAGGLPRARYPRRRRLYDLAGPEASRSPEWREGIARSPRRRRAGARASSPLSRCGRRAQSGRPARHLSGSPALVLALLRPQDRLIACELEPNAAAALARHLGRDRRSKAIALDGWTALNAYVPPKERRPGADRSAVRGRGRFSAARPGAGGRAPQMAGRQLPAVVSDQGARGPDALARGCGAPGIAKISAPRSALPYHQARTASAPAV